MNCTPERLESMSQRMTEMMLDPTSAFRTPEAEQRKSESLKRKHKDPNAVWNTAKWRKARSDDNHRWIENGTHPFIGKNTRCRVSNGERELAMALTSIGAFVLNDYAETVGPYFPDIINHDKRVIVEYYGDYHHANPTRYAPDDYIKLHRITAREIWKHDAERIDYITKQGWRVFVVWERDWNCSHQAVIELLTSLIS